ncbi:unnamed protein product [Anisakis simplex]|uniref:Apoptotic chromatin condensation inducer in the nucleus-like n=1 Tax=Anisakis simplex TaxID=6269 RepID=A0A0M3JB18_ANISI|nr:unnamed protein product [Anisakis simplex]
MSGSVEVGTVKTHSSEKESSQLSEKTKATVVSDTKKTSKEDDLKKMPKPKEEKSDAGDVIAESVESAGVCSTSPCPSTVKQELSETVSGSDEEGRLLRATSRQRDRRKLSSRERRGTQSPGSANGSDQTATKDNDEATKDKDKCAGNERKERSKKIVDESYQPATVFVVSIYSRCRF